MNIKNSWKIVLAGVAIATGGFVACGGGDSTTSTTTYIQVERLARPGINEALVLTPAYQDAFNSIPPSQDLSSAATPVLTEAGVVLGAVAAVGVAAGTIPYTDAALGEGSPTDATAHVQKVVNGFIPDVMRINTAAVVAVGESAYDGNVSGGTPIGACIGTVTASGVTGAVLSCGRKLKDDVIDMTYNYLAGGTVTLAANTLGDDATYDKSSVTGNVNSSRSAPQATFPFLAKPY